MGVLLRSVNLIVLIKVMISEPSIGEIKDRH